MIAARLAGLGAAAFLLSHPTLALADDCGDDPCPCSSNCGPAPTLIPPSVVVTGSGEALDVVTTRDLFNEGVDVPDVDMIVFMRVTHSRRIFVQQLGRGLRISPKKKKVVVLDFVSDLRRLAEVVELERAVKGDVERLRLPSVIQFRDEGAGTFMLDWMKDQADLFMREGDPTLELPAFDFPSPHGRGGVQ